MKVILIELGLGFVAAAFLWVLISRYASRLTAKTKTKIDDSVTPKLVGLIHFLLIACFLVFVAAVLGANVGPLVAGAGVAGLGIALALKDGILGDLVCILSIYLGRKFDIGDTIEVSGVKGVIKELTLSDLVIETVDEESVYVPLKKVTGGIIKKG